jgi:acyl carrier protein
VGGEAFPVELPRRWAGAARRFINGYGPTEATVAMTLMDLRADADSTPMGRPMANQEAYVLSPHGRLVPAGAVGELHVGGAGLARGYLNRPEVTAEKFVRHPFSARPGARLFRTGDLVRLRPDGDLEFMGRCDRQVKLRGFRVELGEIEAVLGEDAEVRQAVVERIDDPEHGAMLVAYLVPAGAGIELSQLRERAGRQLPGYMVPARFVVLPALPLTANGKLDRVALAAAAAAAGAASDGSAARVAPRTPLEQRIADEVFKPVLGVGAIGVTERFFELGGNSLQATQIVARLRAAFDSSVTLASFFEEPTVAAVARIIEAAERERAAREAQVADALRQLESISDDQAAALLGAKGSPGPSDRPGGQG